MKQELNAVLSQLDSTGLYLVMLWIKVNSLSSITCQTAFFFAKAEVKHAGRYLVEARGAVCQGIEVLPAS